MNRTQKLKTLGFALLSVLIIAAIGVYYIASVRRSMRNQSVTDVLEVTAHGSHAFDVYAAKDAEILHSLTFIMEKEEIGGIGILKIVVCLIRIGVKKETLSNGFIMIKIEKSLKRKVNFMKH